MTTPVCAPASVPQHIAEAYARLCQAKRLDDVLTFIDELYHLCPAVGINPTILVAQSAHETGDPTTGRGWQSPAWVERLNPAGIGITDSRDFGYTFHDGREAARALCVHHAAYIFGRLPPALEPYRALDPRFDAVLRAGYGGTVSFLEDYGNGKWASDPDYAAKIKRHLSAIIALDTERSGNTKMPNIYDWWLDEPRTVNNTVYQPVYRYYKDRAGYRPQIIVLHIQEGSNLGSWIHFHNVLASATVLIAKNGDIWRLVRETDAPWTNGDVCFPTKLGKAIMDQFGADPNYYTLSIETEGFTNEWPKPQQQLDSVLWQIRQWMQRYGIPKSRILRHADINQCSRAQCPGDAYYEWVMNHLDDAPVQDTVATPQPILVNGQPWDGSRTVTVNGITFVAQRGTVTVEKDELRPHKWASKESPVTGAPRKRGETIPVLGWVHGERVGTEDRWWVATDFSRYWAGGTVEKPSEAQSPVPPAEGDTSSSTEAPRTRFGLVHYRAAPDGKGRMITVIKQAVVRKVPLLGTDVVANVNPGDKLLAIEWTRSAEVKDEDIWWRVAFPDGSTGYLWAAATDARPY